MITYEEVREHYADGCAMCTKLECDDCEVKLVIEALEKQIPKKPIWRWDGNETVIDCPNCGKYPFDLSEYEWARIFCGHCGQRIDWSEVE